MNESLLPPGARQPDEILLVDPFQALMNSSLGNRMHAASFSAIPDFIDYAEDNGYDRSTFESVDNPKVPLIFSALDAIEADKDLELLRAEWQLARDMEGAVMLLGSAAVREGTMTAVESRSITKDSTASPRAYRETLYKGPLAASLDDPEVIQWMDDTMELRGGNNGVYSATSYAAFVFGSNFVTIDPQSKTYLEKIDKTIWQIGISTGKEGPMTIESISF